LGYAPFASPDGEGTSVRQGLFSGPWIAEPSTEALKTAIRHLEAIPPESDVYAQAAELLPLLRLKRDRPQDFPAVEQAKFLSCVAKDKAREAELQEQGIVDLRHDTRDTALEVECAPLAGSDRIAHLKALVPFP